MLTYNHEQFIEQAIESVLMQETNFPVELLIGEDCSTDGTREIVKRYAVLRPDAVRPLLHEKNAGAFANFHAARKACRGKYIAMLEGDDYWTSPRKLQTQVDFLDQHPDHSICGTRFVSVSADQPGASPYPSPIQKESGALEDLLRWNYLLTCTVVFRAGLITEVPRQFSGVLNSDMVAWVLLAQHGRVGYINELMAAYRMHGGGVWIGSSIETRIAALEKTIGAIHSHLGNRYPRLHRASLCIRYVECAEHYTRAGDYTKARRWLRTAFVKSPVTFVTLAEARLCAMENVKHSICGPLKNASGRCIAKYHQARIWAGAHRRRLWKALTGRPHGANPGRPE
jgi:glycosyltransferase involved in cell wall biosynthesis